MTAEQIKKEIEQAQKALRGAEKMGIEKFVTKAKDKIAKLEAELAEIEKSSAKPEPKEKKEKQQGRGLKEALDQKDSDKVIQKIGGRKKHKFDESGKIELDGGHVVTKKNDTTAVLMYKGKTHHTVGFSFENGKWVIDCCETKHEKYPNFEKGEIDDAIHYIIGELECREARIARKKTKQRQKNYAKKQDAKPEPQKVADAIEKVAERVEKTVEKAKSDGEPVTTAKATEIAHDIKSIVKAVENGMKSRSDGKEFVKKLIAELSKLL